MAKSKLKTPSKKNSPGAKAKRGSKNKNKTQILEFPEGFACECR